MVSPPYKEGSDRLTSNNMFLNLPRDVIRSTARIRFCVYTPRFETATWNQSNSPTCDLFDIISKQDEQHVLSHCVNPRVISLQK
jgi:hypothetical protein